MKNIYSLIALVLLAGSAFAANTAQPNQTNVVLDQDQRFAIPQDKNKGNADLFAKWSPAGLGRDEYTVSVTTIVAAGSGLVDAICVSSGAVNDYAVLYDTTAVYTAAASATVGNYTALSTLQTAVASYGRVHIQHTFPATESTSDTGGAANAGCSEFNIPIPFSNGLYIQHSSTGLVSFIRYRLLRR